MTAKAIFELDAEVRSEVGRGASRRLRRNLGKIPAIMYGGGEDPQQLSLAQNKVFKALQNPSFYSHLLTLSVDGKKNQVVLKDLQRHPYKPMILHMDFLRVRATDRINMKVPIHFVGEDQAPGIKKGGVINHQLIDIEIRCLVSKLPDGITVDISQLELDQAIHLSDLKLPEGIDIIALSHGNDMSIVSIHLPKQIVEEETAAPAAEGEAGAEGAAPAATAAPAGAKEGDKGKAAETKPEKGKGK